MISLHVDVQAYYGEQPHSRNGSLTEEAEHQ